MKTLAELLAELKAATDKADFALAASIQKQIEALKASTDVAIQPDQAVQRAAQGVKRAKAYDPNDPSWQEGALALYSTAIKEDAYFVQYCLTAGGENKSQKGQFAIIDLSGNIVAYCPAQSLASLDLANLLDASGFSKRTVRIARKEGHPTVVKSK